MNLLVKKNNFIKIPLILLVLLLLVNFSSLSQTLSDCIKINQIGFYPGAPKIAVVTGEVVSGDFYITSTNLRDTVFTGKLSNEKQSANSTVKTKIADFSALKEKGSFVVCVPGVGNSYVFAINNGVNKKTAMSSLKGYYYQRVSMPLEERFAGKWHRSAGHPDTAVYIHSSAATKARPEGGLISSPGGWYDAGDYNKYMVNSGITLGTLLSAYEDFPAYFKMLHTNIPESNNGVPDILNEALYNLRWMLTMQDPNDGGVYNKCTNTDFDGMVMPGVTQLPRYVVQKRTGATLDFAAVTAQASRIFEEYQNQFPGLADSCLKASEAAWKWSLLHPDLEYNQRLMNKDFKPEIITGGYGDKNFNDEWLWAAAELFITTKKKDYLEILKKHLTGKSTLPTWNNVGMLANYSLLRFEEQVNGSLSKELDLMKKEIMLLADNYLKGSRKNAFATVMGQSVKDFNWGGNANAANQGILLIRAYLMSSDKKYVDHALSNLDYLSGRNATGYCFITGLGSKSPMHPHHRQSISDGVTEPVPGLLVGGPNPGRQDNSLYEFTEPETSYTDHHSSYASNEIAINWNAPLVYLANAIEALQAKVGYSEKGK